MAFSTVLYLNRSVILRAWSKPQVHPEPVVKEKKGKRKGKKTGKVESGVENRKVENGKGVESRKFVFAYIIFYGEASGYSMFVMVHRNLWKRYR